MQSITRREDFIGELPSPLGARGFILSGEKLYLFFVGGLIQMQEKKETVPFFCFKPTRWINGVVFDVGI